VKVMLPTSLHKALIRAQDTAFGFHKKSCSRDFETRFSDRCPRHLSNGLCLGRTFHATTKRMASRRYMSLESLKQTQAGAKTTKEQEEGHVLVKNVTLTPSTITRPRTTSLVPFRRLVRRRNGCSPSE